MPVFLDSEATQRKSLSIGTCSTEDSDSWRLIRLVIPACTSTASASTTTSSSKNTDSFIIKGDEIASTNEDWLAGFIGSSTETADCGSCGDEVNDAVPDIQVNDVRLVQSGSSAELNCFRIIFENSSEKEHVTNTRLSKFDIMEFDYESLLYTHTNVCVCLSIRMCGRSIVCLSFDIRLST